ncbi:site-specific integrase [Hyphomicrobium sp. D-2]|uniref:tyrosine-type recombinase/integrase n=1 Tax=Hyphomicrobium sp. D-2 TaxID=3041621 RepID=UPI002455A080|nr:site-specific integrase [Hyphomicrobium sp. D-2]MDH4983832.1 site-specific integrase [Hyphomicrobium sp. D-2]
MITLLEHRALPAVEGVASGWSRQGQAPSIRRDGDTYDANLDRFLADLPLNGVRSHHSVRSYAYDLLVWVRFLDEARSKTVWQATRADVDSYHRARRQDDAANRISASSWNRAVAALDKLYRWAVEESVIAQSPFTYRDVWRRIQPGQGRTITIARNQAYERAARRSDVKFITIEDYRRFRDVGLRGLAVDGGERHGARDRNGSRNALFADLLISTGLRLEEASSFLACEVEEAIKTTANGDKQVAVRLPAALTKGDKGRTIRIPASLLSRLRSYLEVERANGVAKFQARDGSQRMRGPIMAYINDGTIEVMSRNGNRKPLRLETVTPEERRRLVLCEHSGKPIEPAALWLSEIGIPIAPNSWEAIFARASRRCQDADLAFEVSPHQLRHSFAVHMLALLIRQRFGDTSNDNELSGVAYRRLLGDPLQQVQRLLGHSSVATTYLYLDHLAGCQDTVDTAVEELLSGITSPSVVRVAA